MAATAVATGTTAGPIAATATAAAFIAAAIMAAGPGPADIGGPLAGRSRPARRSGCSQPAPLRPTPAGRRRLACAGTTPTRPTGPASGTPAKTLSGGGRRRLARGGLRYRLARPLIFVDGFAYRCEERLFAKVIEQFESLELILHRVFELGKAQSCPGAPERFIQLREGVGRSDIDTR